MPLQGGNVADEQEFVRWPGYDGPICIREIFLADNFGDKVDRPATAPQESERNCNEFVDGFARGVAFAIHPTRQFDVNVFGSE